MNITLDIEKLSSRLDDSKKAIESLIEKVNKVVNVSEFNSMTEHEFNWFEDISGQAIGIYESVRNDSEHYCPCGSNVLSDREEKEEPACGKCFPDREVGYE